jgi:hypothetical protein
MSLTTTTSIKEPRPSVCEVCGLPAPAALPIGADGKAAGLCCASPRQAALIRELNPGWESPVDGVVLRIAADVLDLGQGSLYEGRFPFDSEEKFVSAELARGPANGASGMPRMGLMSTPKLMRIVRRARRS